MDGVQFEENNYEAYKVSNYYQNEKESKVITLLIKSGIVKDKKQANFFLLACTVLFALTSVYAFSKTIEPDIEVIPYDQMTPEQKQAIPPQERAYLESLKNN